MNLLKYAVLIATLACTAAISSGCWQAAAARAAKKRTTQTGYIVGTLENEIGVDDPLGRKQRSLDSSDGDKNVDK